MRFSTSMLLIRILSAFVSSMSGLKNPAVHFQHGACNVTGFGTSQKSDGGSDFFRTTKAPQGDARRGRFAFVAAHGVHGLGLDVAGTDCVDGDAKAGDFLGKRLRERDDARFGGSVIGLAGGREEGAERGNVDDATAALRNHG